MNDGQRWRREIVAYNTATESTNRMHDDEVAATYGFSGGLVPGVDVWAYATGPCVDRWGTDFIERGSIDLRFDTPVYDGETVVAELTASGDLTVTGPAGRVRAGGTASLTDGPPPPKDLPIGELPSDPPRASPDLLTPGTVLGTLRLHHRAGPHTEFLDDVRETGDLYEGGAVCHPGFLARQANFVLSRSVRLGPWIHVRTVAQHRRIVRDGEEMEVRGVVTDEWERKGHRFVEVDVEITAAGEPAWSATHTAIWRPRTMNGD